jgi:hypothetical protein
MDIGANFDGKSTFFRVWAPYNKEVFLVPIKMGKEK